MKHLAATSEKSGCSIAAMTVPLWLMMLVGCDRLDMYDQPRYEALEASRFFGDGLSARPQVEGTIARGGLHENAALYTGKQGKQFVSQIPQAVYRAIYDRNLQKFNKPFDETGAVLVADGMRAFLNEDARLDSNIYCSVCHGRTGDGDGMIVQRGFRRPPTYHSELSDCVGSGAELAISST